MPLSGMYCLAGKAGLKTWELVRAVGIIDSWCAQMRWIALKMALIKTETES